MPGHLLKVSRPEPSTLGLLSAIKQQSVLPQFAKDKNYIVLHLGKKQPTVFKCPINTTQETAIRGQLEISAACHCSPRTPLRNGFAKTWQNTVG